MANTVIALKKSATLGAVPVSLANGEIAINYADGKLYYKAIDGSIQSISGGGGGGGNSFGIANVDGTLLLSDTSNDVLNIKKGTNIELSGDALTDSFTITANLKPAYDTANASYDHANTKTFTFYQSSAPATSNAHDLWVNTTTGVVYENFGNTSNPIWAEFGPVGVSSYSTTNRDADAYGAANAAFDKANTANVLAYNTGIGANAYAVTVGAASNTWANTVGASANNWANTKLANTTGTFAGDLTVTGNVITNKQAVVYYRPSATVNAAVHIASANTKGGASYADIFKLSNLSGGTNIDKWIRLNSTGTLEIINSAYTTNIFEISDVGDLLVSGNSTFNGTKPGYAPNRPAFRVYGDGTTNINATTTLKNTNWAVDFEQGSNLNGTTGIFTAPVAGLYSVNLTARTQNNNYVGTSAIAVIKTSGVLSTNICYIEWYNNTTANHMGSSTIVKLAVGDTLKVVVTAGQVTFDLNDNWAVAYIG